MKESRKNDGARSTVKKENKKTDASEASKFLELSRVSLTRTSASGGVGAQTNWIGRDL